MRYDGKDDSDYLHKYPENETDLKIYREKWIAGKEHYDFKNKTKFKNRYLLYGRPQLGKTLVCFHLLYILWEALGKPEHTSSKFDSVEEEEVEVLPEKEKRQEIKPEYQRKYPNVEHLKSLKLQKPEANKTYGDPNNKSHRDWYLVAGNRRPHDDVRCESKNPMANRTVMRANLKETSTKAESQSTDESTTIVRIPNYNQHSSKKLKMSDDTPEHIRNKYETYKIKLDDGDESAGRLLLRKEKIPDKWKTNIHEFPLLNKALKFSPILIPSCGRQESALLDLSEAMSGELTYLQIVIIRAEEEENYLPYLVSDVNVDVFIMNSSTNPTIGAARWSAKKLAEKITKVGDYSKYCFILDDNILKWEGVTLINDPISLFGRDPLDNQSSRTDISLKDVLEFWSNENIKREELHKHFSIVGFSIGVHKNINNCRAAFSKKHIFAAIFLNIERTRNIHYNTIAWAMEDIDINMRTNESNEILVKCHRFLATKKVIRHGGVKAEIPDEIKSDWEDHDVWGSGSSKATTEIGRPSRRTTLADNKPKKQTETQKGKIPDWFQPFVHKRNAWQINLDKISEESEKKHFREWSADLETENDKLEEGQGRKPAVEMLESVEDLFRNKSFQFKERIEKIIDLIKQIELYFTNRKRGVAVDEMIFKRIEEIREKLKKKQTNKRSVDEKQPTVVDYMKRFRTSKGKSPDSDS